MQLNKELLAMQDPRDIEIARLRRAIQSFKKYDKERKKYLQKIQDELESVSERYCELRHRLPKDVQEAMLMAKAKYEKKTQGLRDTLRGQSKKLEQLNRLVSLVENPEVLGRAEEILKNYTVVQLKNANDSLQKEIDRLRSANKELVMQLVKLKKQNIQDEDKSISEKPNLPS